MSRASICWLAGVLSALLVYWVSADAGQTGVNDIRPDRTVIYKEAGDQAVIACV